MSLIYANGGAAFAGAGQSCRLHDRWSVVLNLRVPPTVLATLANAPMEFVRREVARHTGTLPDVLHQLSHDQVLNVRLAVASNYRTEWRTLAGMVYSRSQRIARAIADHPSTPSDPPLKQLNEL